MIQLLIILSAIVLLAAGYKFYGSWLERQWGVDPKRLTPALKKNDHMDYVAAPAPVLMGHHFSSIAGAGPINGPIIASAFGWLPVFLWCVLGSIFFGGVQDFGALVSSIRNEGKSLGKIISDTIGVTAQRLFIIFTLLVLLFVIASFVNIVAGTFFTEGSAFGIVTDPTANQTTAMISLLFIVLALIYGYVTNTLHVKPGPASVAGLLGIIFIIIFGLHYGIALDRTAWIFILGIYLVVASILPVWVLLQPRDYLSSFLLYAMIIVAIFGIIFSAVMGTTTFTIPTFTGWETNLGQLFPALFITVACGACSGFHALISAGTTSKQISNERYAKPIGYGSMLIEAALGVISLVAVGVVYTQYTSGAFGSPSTAFAAGIATMFSMEGTTIYRIVYALLVLAVSVFALTSLDTAARLNRYLFSELFLKDGESDWHAATGIRKLLAHPLTGTVFMVTVGCILGGLKLSALWALFGAANQLFAVIALLAVCAWLGHAQKNNRMFFIPMVFMLAATQYSLILTMIKKYALISSGNAFWGDWFQLVFAAAMSILAVLLVLEGVETLWKQEKQVKEEPVT